jgi:hypothetical protein
MTIYQPTPEQLEQHFSAMYDSIYIINMFNEKTSPTNDEIDAIKRNKEYLRIMLDKDFIKSDSRDKKVFIAAAK